MTKELSFTLNISDEQIRDDAPVHENFGLTEERSRHLVEAHGDRWAEFKAGDKVNDLALFCEFVEKEQLTGNDIAFLAFTGFRLYHLAKTVAVEELIARLRD